MFITERDTLAQKHKGYTFCIKEMGKKKNLKKMESTVSIGPGNGLEDLHTAFHVILLTTQAEDGSNLMDK